MMGKVEGRKWCVLGIRQNRVILCFHVKKRGGETIGTFESRMSLSLMKLILLCKIRPTMLAITGSSRGNNRVRCFEVAFEVKEAMEGAPSRTRKL